MRKRERTPEPSPAGENDQPRGAAGARADRGTAAGASPRRAANRETPAVDHYEQEGEGVAGEGLEESGTLPGSVGGTTGTSGRAHGIQAPGATVSSLPGVDPAEMIRRRARRGQRPDEGAGSHS